MKIHELITELEKYPEDLDIVIALSEDISYDESISVICESPTLYHDKRINRLMITDGS